MGLLVIVGLVVLTFGMISAAEAKGRKTGEVPFLISGGITGIGSCIDFDSGSVCNSGQGDNDAYLDYLETLMGSDPADASSTPEYGLLDEQLGFDTCRDGLDNDKDGRSDKRDSGCRTTCRDFTAKRNCSDRDRDGWLRYVELRYGSDPNDPSSTPESFILPATCSDGIDNDVDGLVDSADCFGGLPDCIDFGDTSDCPPI